MLHTVSRISVLLVLLSFSAQAQQTSDEKYRQPLKEVLAEIESRFGVTLNYKEEMVNDKWVNYAYWRFANGDVEKTLTSVLAVHDLDYIKQGENKYKIKEYEYYRKPVEEGRAQLDHLATLYHDAASWEGRKKELKQCIWEALQLTSIPPAPGSAPIITNRRKMDGYTIENVAIETLPGLFVCGSLYKPVKQKRKMPVVLCPNGHFNNGRYRPDQQYRCAMLARMGAIAFSYDLFAWGESLLQFKTEDHRRSLAMTMQVLNSLRILDYLCSLKGADTDRVAITGGSGGGSHTMLITALDDRVKVSVPVVMLSSYFSGGCPCESGMPVHLCGRGTNNVEIASMAAPRPQLIISDGKDWTDHVPEIEFPYVKKIYGYYNEEGSVQNVHFGSEGHDYGISKRIAMYAFIAGHLELDIDKIRDKTRGIDESHCTIEEEEAMYVFGKEGEQLPPRAVKSFEALEKVFYEATGKK